MYHFLLNSLDQRISLERNAADHQHVIRESRITTFGFIGQKEK